MIAIYESDATRLSYRDDHIGKPVVFLHPTPFNGTFWNPVIELVHGVRAIVPDLRGHGESELGTRLPAGHFARVPDAPVLTMAHYASDVLALLDHLELEQPVFVGCSIGGYVLLELWRRAPERMKALAFICSKPQADAEANLMRREAAIADARAGKTNVLLSGMVQSLVGATSRAKRPQLADEVRGMVRIAPDALIAVQAGLGARPDSVPTVSSITVPVLAIAGGEDGAATPAEMEAFCAAPGGCTFVVLKDAGHTAAYEQPATVAGLLNKWIAELE
jgi:pimeloyl-ACP methyl ester carboxylesterase